MLFRLAEFTRLVPWQGWLFWVAAALLLTACLASPPAPPSPTPPPPAQQPSEPPRISIPGKAGLSISLPPGYVLETETGATPEIHHVFRREPASLARDATLHIVVAPLRLAHCPDAQGTIPPRTAGWSAPWYACETGAAGVFARESFIPLPGGWIVQLAVVGAPGPELDRLQAIAETLQTP